MSFIVRTNNKRVAVEVLSAQNLLNENSGEISIESISSSKHCINDYDARVIVNDFEFILYRDLNFKNVDIKPLLNTKLDNIKFIIYH